jgi:SAM domain (Sterile alpha motif)
MKVTEFDLDDVCTFLTAIGLGDKAEPFRENCVDGSLLCTLTAEDLTSDLGLTGLQAKKLLRSIDAENNSTHTASASIDTTRDKVAALEAENAALQRAVITARADVRVAQGSQNVAVTTPPQQAVGKWKQQSVLSTKFTHEVVGISISLPLHLFCYY